MRPLHEIADDIRQDWTNMSVHAAPYWRAMRTLYSIEDDYHYDSARSVVRYFLGNAQTWRGEKAREIKKELNSML